VHETNPVTELVADSRCIGSANPWTEPAIELLGLYQSGERLDDRWVQQGIEAHHARMVAVKSEVSRRYEAGDGLHLRDDVSLQQLADAIPLDVPQEVRFGAQMCLELLGCWMGASTTLLQGAEFDYEVGERLGDFPGPHALPVGGMQQVITSLLDKIPGVPVKLNSEVDHIEWGGTGVAIHTSGVEQPISADICVCTLPIGVLKDAISRNDKPLFEPSLPLAKQEAIKRIGISGYVDVLC